MTEETPWQRGVGVGVGVGRGWEAAQGALTQYGMAEEEGGKEGRRRTGETESEADEKSDGREENEGS